MIIRGLTPGNMVGDQTPAQRYDSEFAECPECGGRMKKTAKLCIDCYSEQHNTFGPIGDRAERQERQRRLDLALLAGWTLDDIFGYDPDEPYDPDRDKLPTREQIVERLIKKWWGHVP